MTRALIQCRRGLPFGAGPFSAMLGFEDMGLEIVPFAPTDLPGIERDASDVVVGGVGVVRDSLRAFGRDVPEIEQHLPYRTTRTLGFNHAIT